MAQDDVDNVSEGPYSPSRHESAFAVTVHQSQAPRCDQTLLRLAELPARVFNLELLYRQGTGICFSLHHR